MGIKKIAKIAGVSIGTVDRALHNRGRVSEETRKKILEIAGQIDYKPNLLARSLVQRKHINIAILMPNPAEDEYWQQAWGGFESLLNKAKQQGINIKSYFYPTDSCEIFNQYAGQILNDKPDGLILAPNYLDSGLKLFAECEKYSIPVVIFDTNLPGVKPFCFIGTDLYQSGQLSAQLLEMITHGEGNFAIFHFDEPFSDSQSMLEKEKGFTDFIKSDESAGMCRSFLINSQQNPEEQLDAAFENNFSGCMVSTSKTFLVGEYLKKHQLSDVKLIGFDLISKNIDLLKEGWIDFLINQNPRRQARKSLNTFINHFAFHEEADEKELFPIEIIAKGNLNSNL
jgi:LacI family transcriptional regulator